MPINPNQLRGLIRETLGAANLYSRDAVELLMGTAAQESAMGNYIKQLGGPALGIFQMEPATEKDIWENFLIYRQEVAISVRAVTLGLPNELAWNLKYAILMARVHYLRVPHPLPDRCDVAAMAAYWKTYFNTPKGRGTVEDFVFNYHRYAK